MTPIEMEPMAPEAVATDRGFWMKMAQTKAIQAKVRKVVLKKEMNKECGKV
jgi:hypothetical protein